MQNGGRQLVQFTAHKRRAGSNLPTELNMAKKPAQSSTKVEIDLTGDGGSSSKNRNESDGSLVKVSDVPKADSSNRGHYGNLAYRSYLAKDYKRALEYAEKQIAAGSKKYESLILRAAVYKKLGSFDLALRDCLACLDIVRNHPVPYILAVQCYVVQKNLASAYKLTLTALQNVSQKNYLYKKLVLFKAELESQLAEVKQQSQVKTISQSWLKTLPLELILDILKLLPLSDLLIMSQTCQMWRSILIRIPELWANVGLDFSSHRTKGKIKRQDLEYILQAFLTRANERLRSISLTHGPKLDWKWFDSLQQFPRPLLTRLDISSSNVSATFLKSALKAFGAQLTHLTLASCKLSDDAVALLLDSCPLLVHLDISGEGVPSSELFVDYRGGLREAYPSLQWLGLQGTGLGSHSLSSVGQVFPNLNGIDLNCIKFRVILLPQLFECLPKLTDVSLSKMNYIFPDRDLLPSIFQTMGNTYSNLTKLNLSCNSFLNDPLILCLANSVKALKVLNMSYTSIGEAGLSMLKSCPQLECLNLGSCPLINDSAILAFIDSLCIQKSTLGSLDLSGVKLENSTIDLLARSVANFIRELNLSSSSVNLFALQSWIAGPPSRLQHLRIRNCPMISTDFVVRLRNAMPLAQIHHSVQA